MFFYQRHIRKIKTINKHSNNNSKSKNKSFCKNCCLMNFSQMQNKNDQYKKNYFVFLFSISKKIDFFKIAQTKQTKIHKNRFDFKF